VKTSENVALQRERKIPDSSKKSTIFSIQLSRGFLFHHHSEGEKWTAAAAWMDKIKINGQIL
jgi:hypothetical protein